uniref:Uncharacterized protein n=1 Tax=Cacopsylla melanoneura TaxID=428564 RepID=A0A8D8U309_9HEMI
MSVSEFPLFCILYTCWDVIFSNLFLAPFNLVSGTIRILRELGSDLLDPYRNQQVDSLDLKVSSFVNVDSNFLAKSTPMSRVLLNQPMETILFSSNTNSSKLAK